MSPVTIDRLLGVVRALPPRLRVPCTVGFMVAVLIDDANADKVLPAGSDIGFSAKEHPAEALAMAGFTMAEIIDHGPHAVALVADLDRDQGGKAA